MGEALVRFFKSFGWAGQGFVSAVRQERNLRFDLCAAVYAYAFSLFYRFSALEYAVLSGFVFGVIALELVNSAIERAVDCAEPRKNERARNAKDMAAGGVLAFCLGAVVAGVALFWDVTVFAAIGAWFAARPWMLALLALSLAAAFCFVFLYGTDKHGGAKKGWPT